MFTQFTVSKGLLVTAISLGLARGATGGNTLDSKARQVSDEHAGPKATVYVEGSKVAAYNTCSEKTASNHQHRDLMLVSTLDGKVSALDIHNAGSVQWTLETGIGPLMDASIGHFEIFGPDGRYKLIPSLDGGLFRWDGQSVEPVPLSADMLLSSSFKLSDDAVIVGGKETSTYGINAGTGQILYICGVNGCHMFDENESTDEDDIIVIERVQRTCRAVEQRTGAEKWNFSVGQHEVSFLPGSHDDKEGCPPEDDYDEDYHQATVCVEEEEEEEQDAMGELMHPAFKVFISPGTVLAYSPKDPSQLLWKQEFSTAIAAAWTVKEGKLKQIDLFDTKNIPLIGSDGRPRPHTDLHPVLYMGEYNKQAYVHPSRELQESVRDMTAAATGSKDNTGGFPVPRVQWRPYMSTAPSRTPIAIDDQRLQRPWASDSSAVTVWSQYPFDVGYYVLHQSPAHYHVFGPKKNPVFIDSNESGSSKDNEGLEILLSVSATFWWKEILAISLVLALGMQFLCHMLRSGATLERVNSLSTAGSISTQESVPEDAVGGTEYQPKQYKSRYLTDFEHQQCLGKGGFGIVFEAKNVVDENSYAVKRICLPNRTKAREKVLREARALARLDHSGIVRYFNSWLEEPPAGWQKIQDDHLFGDSVNLSHTTLFSHSTTANFNKDSLLVRDKEQFLSQTSSHPHIPQRSCVADPEVSLQSEPGDFSEGAGYLSNLSEESDSFRIEFRDNDHNGDEAGERDESEFNLTPKADEFATFHLGENGDCNLLTPVNAPLNVPFGGLSSFAPSRRVPDRESTGAFPAVFDSDTSDYSTAAKLADKSSVTLDESDRDHQTLIADLEPDENSFQVVFEIGKPEHSAANTTVLEDASSLCCNHSDCLASSAGGGREVTQIAFPARSSEEGLGGGDGQACPPVPRVYLYIQMQLCQKETLKDWLGANTLSRDRMKLLHIFQQILAAVQYVHSCGMIHRDLKPSNIFFSVDGTVKVGDFGLVTAVDTQLETGETLNDDLSGIDPSKTHTGQVGTQLYMSPEQLTGKSYDHKVDIFSLGLIFFELLHPFGTQMERIMVMTGSRQQKFPDRFAKELPLETELIKMLLSSNPMERPDTDEIMEKDIFMRLYKDFIPPNPPANRGRYASNSSN